jgi:hypothetical protein
MSPAGLVDVPGQIGPVVYDNGLGDFLQSVVPALPIRVSVDKRFTKLVDVVTSQQITGRKVGDRTVFDLTLETATYREF